MIDPDTILPRRRVLTDKRRFSPGKGDIDKSCSISSIAMGPSTLKKPFAFEGRVYVATSGSYRADGMSEVECYHVMPYVLFTEPVTRYGFMPDGTRGEKADWSEICRANPKGFYHGMEVEYQKEAFVLCGPPVIFCPASAEIAASTAAKEDPESPREPLGTSKLWQQVSAEAARCLNNRSRKKTPEPPCEAQEGFEF